MIPRPFVSPCAIVATALLATAQSQKLVLPDNHYLMERVDQLGNAGESAHWRTSAGRTQILYEASHFTGKAGVSGPITITRLQFRGEDGEPNLGGQVYSGVTIELGATSLGEAAMSTTFATNRAAATTAMGTPGTTTVTLAASAGTCPNNWCIDIDLAAIGAAFTFDPTSARPNLLIDISMPGAPANAPPLYLIPIQDTTAHGAGIRGRAVSTATVGALTGTVDATPPVVGIEFTGSGGYTTLIPARNEEYGASCGGACSTFYQTFNQGQPFDVTGLTLVPDSAVTPTYYTVIGSASAVDFTQLNATPNSTADDGLITQALGFTWRYPGGSTTTIKPVTNGFVWLDGAMTATQYPNNKANLLGGTTTAPFTARYLPFWSDLHCGRNSTANPLAGLHVRIDSSGGAGNHVVYTTWNDVGLFRVGSAANQPGHSSYTFQLVMYEATGNVEFRYGTMDTQASGLWTTGSLMHYSSVVGFTRGLIGGTTSQDPQSRDLSHEVPFSTQPEGALGNVAIVSAATPVPGGPSYFGRAFGGQSLSWVVSNIPPGAVVALVNLDLSASQPGIQLPGITAPGCRISTSLSPAATGFGVFVLPPSLVTTGLLPIPHGVQGAVITAQAVGVDLFGGPVLIPWASNALKHTIGLD